MTTPPSKQGMTFGDKVRKLLTLPGLGVWERQGLNMVLEVNGGSLLEGRLTPEYEAHIVARFTWYFTPDGVPRDRI